MIEQEVRRRKSGEKREGENEGEEQREEGKEKL